MFSIHPKNGFAVTTRPLSKEISLNYFALPLFNILFTTTNADDWGKKRKEPKKRAYLLL